MINFIEQALSIVKYAPFTLYMVFVEIFVISWAAWKCKRTFTNSDIIIFVTGTICSYLGAQWKVEDTVFGPLHSLHIVPFTLFMYLPLMQHVNHIAATSNIFFSMLIVDTICAFQYFKNETIYVQVYGIGGAGLLDGLVLIPLVFVGVSWYHRTKYSQYYQMHPFVRAN